MYEFGVPISSICKGEEAVLYAGLWNGTIISLDYMKKEVIDKIVSSENEIKALTYDDGLVYAAGADTVIKAWNFEVK